MKAKCIKYATAVIVPAVIILGAWLVSDEHYPFFGRFRNAEHALGCWAVVIGAFLTFPVLYASGIRLVRQAAWRHGRRLCFSLGMTLVILIFHYLAAYTFGKTILLWAATPAELIFREILRLLFYLRLEPGLEIILYFLFYCTVLTLYFYALSSWLSRFRLSR